MGFLHPFWGNFISFSLEAKGSDYVRNEQDAVCKSFISAPIKDKIINGSKYLVWFKKIIGIL